MPVDPAGDTRDETEGDDLAEPAARARPVERWRQGTASGAVAAGLALGFQRVFDPERADTIAIELEAPAEPVDGDGLEVRFDPLSSQGTVVVVRRPSGPADT